MGLFAAIERELERENIAELFEIKTKPEPSEKLSEAPPPDLSKIQPEDIPEYTDLWHRACELENYTSGDAPYQDRAARMPELNELESRTKAVPAHRSVKKIPGNTEPNQDQCFSCHGRSWWRKNEPNSKWICRRCHPSATGLDVIFKNE